MLPVRSTTAAASVSSPNAVAAISRTALTSSAVRMRAGPPARSAGVFWVWTPALAQRRSARAATLARGTESRLDLAYLSDEAPRIVRAGALELLEQLIERCAHRRIGLARR